MVELTAFPDEVLGRYRLGECIAAGSFGTVVAATDLCSGDAVAVKFFDGAADNTRFALFAFGFIVLPNGETTAQSGYATPGRCDPKNSTIEKRTHLR